jgi:hypothetical protein
LNASAVVSALNLGLLLACQVFAISPEKGARTIVHLASSPDVAEITGKYFNECRKTTPSVTALDDRAASLLWDRSAAVGGIKA